MEDDHKIEIFKNVLSKIMFSNVFQFRFSGIIEFFTSSTGDNYYSKFSNESRSLKVNLRLASKNDAYGERLSITIAKKDQGDIDDEPYFLLTEWLDSSGREQDRKKFYLNTYEGTFEEKLKSFFVYLNELFEDEELSKVLRGEIWMNFGFDWKGMK